MPVVFPDPSAADVPTTGTVYVWQSFGQPGDFGLCTNRQHHDFQNADWRFRGELTTVPELNGFPRPTIDKRTVNGWPMTIHRNQQGNFVF